MCQDKEGVKQVVKNLSLKTFKKWSFKEDFSAETDEQGYIVSLVWKLHCDSLEGMKIDSAVNLVQNL